LETRGLQPLHYKTTDFVVGSPHPGSTTTDSSMEEALRHNVPEQTDDLE